MCSKTHASLPPAGFQRRVRSRLSLVVNVCCRFCRFCRFCQGRWNVKLPVADFPRQHPKCHSLQQGPRSFGQFSPEGFAQTVDGINKLQLRRFCSDPKFDIAGRVNKCFLGEIPGVHSVLEEEVADIVLWVIGINSGAWSRSEEHTSELQSLMRISY